MSKDHKEYTYQDLKDFFEGKYSEENAADHQSWMADPANASRLEKYLHLLWQEEDSDPSETKRDLSHILDKVHHSIRLEEAKGSDAKTLFKKTQEAPIRKILLNLGKVAAILLLPLLAYNGWEIYRHNTWMKNQQEIVYNEIQCPMGAKSRFILPDGTTGSLNNGSTLRYPVKFSGEQREVELYGEAYFDVVHSKRMPFIIKTVALDVRVLGTRVNVYSYPDEAYQEITLESGSVEVIQETDGQELIIAEMKPGQHLHYDYRHQGSPGAMGPPNPITINEQGGPQQEPVPGLQEIIRVGKGDLFLFEDQADRYTGWTDGKLILRNDPMPVLLRRVERWYSVKFNVLDQQINDYTYRATFEEENLDQVLKLLSLTGPLEFTKVPREQNADGTFNIQEINITIK